VSNIIILLFLTSLQVSASSPEEMYGMYDKDGKYREMAEQVEQIRLRSEEAQKEKQTKNMIILVLQIIVLNYGKFKLNLNNLLNILYI